MLSYNGKTVKTSVRRLVEFIFRSGDIRSGSGMITNPEVMLEGGRLHRKIQNKQKGTYRSEVPLKMSWLMDDYELVLEGRADGIDRGKLKEFSFASSMEDSEVIYQDDEEVVFIDEIKCVLHSIENVEEAQPLHLAQAKCYAYMYASLEHLNKIGVQITYCQMESEEIRKIFYLYPMTELTEWFEDLLDSYKMWADFYVKARRERNVSIEKLNFPFEYRSYQKRLVAIIYKAIHKKTSVLLQAPTGVGKTISAIFPALKSMNEGMADHIYYLTAKTITRTVAEETLEILRKQGLRLRSVTITAKEKICVMDEMNCDPEYCPRAKGHFDRINEAVYQLLRLKEDYTREALLEYSEIYRVCPYELSFECALWGDMVICDYNYVFDPYVNRREMFSETTGDTLYLIDESHNLPDRAREMYSQSISENDFKEMKKVFRLRSKTITKRLQKCIGAIDQIKNKEEYSKKEYSDIEVDGLYFPLLHLVAPLEDYLKENEDFEDRETVFEFFFTVLRFLEILDDMEEGYLPYAFHKEKDFVIRLFCVDPSLKLEQYLAKSQSAIFYSATLLPVPYFKQLLGGDNHLDAYSIPSSFSKEKRLICITSDVTSRYKRRGEDEYKKIIRYLESMIQTKQGNYMIFFPSYEMLNQVLALAQDSNLVLFAGFLVQTPDMTEKSREEFLAAFEERTDNKGSLIAFCVLGSIFSEGIDLTGRRLIGAAIVGTGLPMICREREMIRAYFDKHKKKGYDYAYRYPGINKVLQAAGRVIRTASDVGVILLMDDRFLLHENQILLPQEWDRYFEVNQSNVSTVLRDFWAKHQE